MGAERSRTEELDRDAAMPAGGDRDDRDDPESPEGDEIDLPLPDDEAGEDAPEAGELDDDLLPPDAEGDPFDDSEASDLEMGDEIDPVEEEGGLGDEGEIDVGALDEGLGFDDERIGEDDPEGS